MNHYYVIEQMNYFLGTMIFTLLPVSKLSFCPNFQLIFENYTCFSMFDVQRCGLEHKFKHNKFQHEDWKFIAYPRTSAYHFQCLNKTFYFLVKFPLSSYSLKYSSLYHLLNVRQVTNTKSFDSPRILVTLCCSITIVW